MTTGELSHVRRAFPRRAAVLAGMLLLVAASPVALAAGGWSDDPPKPDCPDSSPSQPCKKPENPKTLETVTVVGHWFPLFGGGLLLGGGGYLPIPGPVAFSPVNDKPTTDKDKNKVQCQGYASDPVEVASGTKVLNIPLFSVPGEMGLRYVLYYRSVSGSALDMLSPWTSSLSYRLAMYCGNPMHTCNQVSLYRPDGSSIDFSGSRTSYGNFPEIGGGGLATLVHNSNGTWTLHDEDTTVQTYDSVGRLKSIKDPSGIGWSITSTVTTSTQAVPAGSLPPVACIPEYPGDPNCPDPPPQPVTTTTTTVVTHTDGRSFTETRTISTMGSGQFGSVTVTDPGGNQYTLMLSSYRVVVGSGTQARSYAGTKVTSLTFPGSPASTMGFSYTAGTPILTGVEYNGNAYWVTAYDSNNRVSSDGAADGSEHTSIRYDTSGSGMVATITNPLGLTTTNSYSVGPQGNYQLASISNTAVQGCSATTNSFTWDGNGNLAKTIDNNGIAHTYTYEANGQLQTETEASGTSLARKTNYVWDTNQQLNRLLSVTVPGAAKASYTYTSHNRLASVSRTNLTGVGSANQMLTTSYAYSRYSNGMVKTLKVTHPSPNNSDHITYQYDTHGNLTSATDGLGHATTRSNYNALGRPGKVVGPNGDETDFTWDARGRLVSKTTHPNGGTATWTYVYDGFGQLAKVTAPDGEVTTWTRDAEMRVTSITHNDKDGTSTETLGYDAMGNVISDVINRGSDIGKSSRYVYNARGEIYQVKGSHGQKLTYAYDGNGNVLSVTDALGHKTRYASDALNRVTAMTDAANGITRFAYDKGDHVAKVTDPRGLVTTYSYDGLGLMWKQVSPDTGTTTLTYDAYGRLASRKRADGVTASYNYDALNRPTKVTAGGQSRTFTWDNCSNGRRRLCAAATSTSSVDYDYTPEGWIAARGFSFTSGPVYTLGFGYNAMGQLVTVAYPDGNQAIYDYSRGAVYQVRVKIGSSTICCAVGGVTYRPMDLAMSAWTSRGGLTNTIGYDSDLRPTSISVPNVESLSFTYDAADRITKLTNGLDSSMTQTFGYDSLNRLINVTSGADHESYSYDADGNRLNAVINGVTWTYTTSSTSNRLVHASNGSWSGPYQYDAQGNMLGTTHQYWTYGPFNRMRTAIPLAGSPVTTYDVSAEDQRLRKYTSTTRTYFAPAPGGGLLAEYTSSWSDSIRVNGRLVAVIKSGAIYPVHTDQTGRPEAITDASHSILWRARNSAFSRSVMTNVWGDFNLGFPGQYHDEELGKWHNGYRDYDAALGRYLESDPIGLAGGINTYAYVGNNPVSNVDPTGLIGYFCQHGNNVKIVLPIAFTGNYTTDQIANMISGINNAWTGQFDNYTVTMVALAMSAPTDMHINTIAVVQGSGRSRVYGPGLDTGLWFSNPSYINNLDYAHEAGHLLGLPEEPLTSNTLMGNLSVGVPNQSEMNAVLSSPVNQRTCGCDQ